MRRGQPGHRCAREHRLVVGELAGTHACNQAGHRLGGIGRIEKQRLAPGEQLDRFLRLDRGHSVAAADEAIVHLDRGVVEALRRGVDERRDPGEERRDDAFQRCRRLVRAHADHRVPGLRGSSRRSDPPGCHRKRRRER